LDELGLEHALKNGKLKSLLNKADIEYQTNLDINSTLADEHQTAIYRICQEAVTNCIKHSSASQLLVQLSVNKQAIDLIIKDNGEQVRNNAESGGYGLLFIEERVLALGGKCSFDTQDGFTIKVSF
ncbi:MAG: ATP-binding protein, partial [Pseudomonadota bacterium]|nr:ATP-binding protein [Pseudomonadota bacterium]